MLTFYVKRYILDVSQGSEYASVICYSSFGKTEDASQAWILAPDAMSSKNRVMSHVRCFTVDTVVWQKVNFFIKSYQCLETQAFCSISLFCSGFSFYENVNWQFIQNHKMCLSKKIFQQYFVGFLPCLGQLLLWKHMSLHSSENCKRFKPPLTIYTRKVK